MSSVNLRRKWSQIAQVVPERPRLPQIGTDRPRSPQTAQVAPDRPRCTLMTPDGPRWPQSVPDRSRSLQIGPEHPRALQSSQVLCGVWLSPQLAGSCRTQLVRPCWRPMCILYFRPCGLLASLVSSLHGMCCLRGICPVDVNLHGM